MILKLLWWAYERLIGHLPPGEAAVFRKRLEELLSEVVSASVEGAARGLRET